MICLLRVRHILEVPCFSAYAIGRLPAMPAPRPAGDRGMGMLPMAQPHGQDGRATVATNGTWRNSGQSHSFDFYIIPPDHQAMAPPKDRIAGRLKPPFVGLGLLGISALIHMGLAPTKTPIRCAPCAAVLAALGFIILGWSLSAFWKRRTSPLPGSRPNTLVIQGPYHFSRNPMYVAATMLLLGVAFSIGSLPFLIPPIGFFLVMQCLYIPHEERRMAEQFGASYEDYRSRVRRWL